MDGDKMRFNAKCKMQNAKLRKFKICNLKFAICNSKKGFTLIEVLIALTILAVGLLGVALMQVTSISGNTFSREMSVATELGQDILEKIRTVNSTCNNGTTHAFLRDTTLVAAHPDITDTATGLVNANPINELGTTNGPGLQYTRQWTVTPCNSPATNMQTIIVTVNWTEKGAALPRSITITGVKVRS